VDHWRTPLFHLAKDLRWARLFFLKQDAEAAKAMAFLLELPMGFLPVRGSPMVSCALICFSVSARLHRYAKHCGQGLETELAKLSYVSAKFRAMESVSLFSSDVCEPVLARARKLFGFLCRVTLQLHVPRRLAQVRSQGLKAIS